MASNTIVFTSVTTQGNKVTLIPQTTIPFTNLINKGNYNFIIQSGLKATANYPVYIQTSQNQAIPLLTKYGNQALANQIYTGYFYGLGYGNQNTNNNYGQFVVFNSLCTRGTESALVTTSDTGSTSSTSETTSTTTTASASK